jgi:hypothetical protein
VLYVRSYQVWQARFDEVRLGTVLLGSALSSVVWRGRHGKVQRVLVGWG